MRLDYRRVDYENELPEVGIITSSGWYIKYTINRSRGSSGAIVTLLQLDYRGMLIQFSDRNNRIFSPPQCPRYLRGLVSLISSGYRGHFPHPELNLLWLRCEDEAGMFGVITPLPYTFITHTSLKTGKLYCYCGKYPT